MKLVSIKECRECGSSALSIFTAKVVLNGIQQNRLNTNDVRCEFVLGCDECGETLRIVSADSVAEYLMRQRASQPNPPMFMTEGVCSFIGGIMRERDAMRAELEAARKQEPIKLSEDVREYLQEGINSATQCEDADMDYDFANELGKLLDPLYAMPPLAGQVVVPEWVPVSERLPDEHKAEYLCLFDGGHQQVSEWLLDETEGWGFWYGNPTHWMPLPAAPALLATPSMEVKHDA